ncbi:MAG: hypothetical protein R3B13_13615 [Polyangiaceae bacterium]
MRLPPFWSAHPGHACGALLGLVALLPACSDGEDAESDKPTFQPSMVARTPSTPGSRGFLDRRGLIHAHSVYSHDACDGEPRDPGTDAINAPCLQDFRDGVCATQHDFVMLTDHNESFARSEYPDVLLHDAKKGDQLLERGGGPVANWLACPDGSKTLILAGTETETMPVGLEGHVADTPEERSAVYGAKTPEALATLKAQGAVSLLQHTEDWTVDELSTMPIDGFEMYNLHANTFAGAAAVFGLVGKVPQPELLPHSDLVIAPIFNEDPAYLSRWGGTLARGVKRVTTMGTDCHRNSIPGLLPDGERIDSYRRMMIWFSNHLLVSPGTDGGYDDLSLKEALRAGRLYGAFEYLGYPDGFDFHAESADKIHEMGAELKLSAGVTLSATAPAVLGLSKADAQPTLRTVVYRAKADGWDQVADGGKSVTFSVDKTGAYRVEVRMVPKHLKKFLVSYSDLAEQEFVWIYSNAIYVR